MAVAVGTAERDSARLAADVPDIEAADAVGHRRAAVSHRSVVERESAAVDRVRRRRRRLELDLVGYIDGAPRHLPPKHRIATLHTRRRFLADQPPPDLSIHPCRYLSNLFVIDRYLGR